jgi:hypothetical protein
LAAGWRLNACGCLNSDIMVYPEAPAAVHERRLCFDAAIEIKRVSNETA